MSLTINTHGKAAAMMADITAHVAIIHHESPQTADAIEDAVFGIMSIADYVTKWHCDDPSGLAALGWTDRMKRYVWSAEALADDIYMAIIDAEESA